MSRTIEVLILRGLPSSGKTTFANNYIKSYNDTILVNRNDLCDSLGLLKCYQTERFTEYDSYNSCDCKLLDDLEISLIITSLINNKNVIIDSNNLTYDSIYKLLRIISSNINKNRLNNKILVNIKDFFDVDLDTIIKREGNKHKSISGEKLKFMWANIEGLGNIIDIFNKANS